MKITAGLFLLLLLLFTGCRSTPRTTPSPPNRPVQTPVAQAPEVDVPSLSRPSPPPVPEPRPEAVHRESSAPAEQIVTGDGMSVSRELYEKTFHELERLIKKWNDIIARRDYETWYSYLSRAYIKEKSSPFYLAALSRMQKLKSAGVVLRSLKDYFRYVVVPSRTDAALDKIAFVNENRVKAYAIIDGEPVILFYVVREDGQWKIGTSKEE